MKTIVGRVCGMCRAFTHLLVALSLGCLMVSSAAANARERGAAKLFDRISDDPVLLRVFLRHMPKGGDLHIHAAGTPYAEEYLSWAAARDYCVSVDSRAVAPPPCAGPEKTPAKGLARHNPGLYAEVVDALSVRDHLQDVEVGLSGHEQFFSTFGKFYTIVSVEAGKTLASSKRAASEDALSYLELMANPGVIDGYAVQSVDPEWDPADLHGAFMRFEPEIEALVGKARLEVDATEAEAYRLLDCEGDSPQAGCDVEVYYNCYGLRLLPPEQLFRQLALCFALIDADPRHLGMSLVQPEDDPVAIADYDLHMQMVAYLNSRYPAAKVSLHAGELTMGLAPAYAMRSHIADAIEIAGSRRIGHGVDIAFELDSRKTLERMAREGIAVEINLVSNDVILGVRGKEHPLNLYRASGVPFVLCSDDLGVLRTDLTEQYVKAALEHGLRYRDLKGSARNSLEYSFLPGESLWMDRDYARPVSACRDRSSDACAQFVTGSPKANLQLKLENDFAAFEQDIRNWSPY